MYYWVTPPVIVRVKDKLEKLAILLPYYRRQRCEFCWSLVKEKYFSQNIKTLQAPLKKKIKHMLQYMCRLFAALIVLEIN